VEQLLHVAIDAERAVFAEFVRAVASTLHRDASNTGGASRFDIPDAVTYREARRGSMPLACMALMKTSGPGFGSSISSAVV
jgi:hypothetical protein